MPHKRYGAEYDTGWLMCDTCKCLFSQESLSTTHTSVLKSGDPVVVTLFTRHCINTERCERFRVEREMEIQKFEDSKKALEENNGTP